MSANWQMLIVGVALIAFGAFITDVRGPMPGASSGERPTLRFRLILIGLGILMSALATVRLIRW
jgi:hypothetical protein